MFVLIFENCPVIVSVKLPWLGGQQTVPTKRAFECGEKTSMNILSLMVVLFLVMDQEVYQEILLIVSS